MIDDINTKEIKNNLYWIIPWLIFFLICGLFGDNISVLIKYLEVCTIMSFCVWLTYRKTYFDMCRNKNKDREESGYVKYYPKSYYDETGKLMYETYYCDTEQGQVYHKNLLMIENKRIMWGGITIVLFFSWRFILTDYYNLFH
tara:strand:- start:60 stop:488 length:429 start_codon:yes stop_codon:yes gene_type:complete